MEQNSYPFSLSGYQISLVILGVICLPIFIRYLVRYLFWRARLKSLKSRNTVVTEYLAPPDIPPAFFGTMIDNRTSIQDMVATILSLINKGTLTFIHDGGSQQVFIEKRATYAEKQYNHERFVTSLFDKNSISTTELTKVLSDAAFEFNFILLQDLQKEGYYLFHQDMQSLTAREYHDKTVRRAIKKGLRKPWNWPGFVLSIVYLEFGLVWILTSLFYYNRLGLFNYKTKKWEVEWLDIAGYYNFLRVVESDRRNSEINNAQSSFKVSEHDPYLTAAQLQKQWQHLFLNSREFGAGGTEYDTL